VWLTVILMGVAAGLEPQIIGGPAYILSRPHPMRLLVPFFVGGFGVSLIAGGVIIFVLGEVNVGKQSAIPPSVEIAVGALSLIVAVLVGTGLAARVSEKAKARHGIGEHDGPSSAEEEASPVSKLPGFEKLPQRMQDALRKESPWIAWIVGVAGAMPTAYYLAAIAAILKSGVGTGGQIAGLLVFNLIMFAPAEIALVSFLVAPDATRRRVDQAYKWMSDHRRLVLTALATIVGVYLLYKGISKL
jgi:hypothetical protein